MNMDKEQKIKLYKKGLWLEYFTIGFNIFKEGRELLEEEEK